ncbi:MAG: 30S ribosomal protein S16 [Kiritimatiellae bacterium]|jgi:small subunit ribosomal protein S16|nr:30S ribosomal protein S16 [Kiritimatiellia bacterium]
MSVRIRLTRVGNRNNPFYRIVVANGINPNNGKAIEYIGTYDPKGGGRSVLKKERYDYWLGVGAIPSDTVRSLIGRSVDHASITQQAKASTSAEEASTEEAPVEEVAEASAE